MPRLTVGQPKNVGQHQIEMEEAKGMGVRLVLLAEIAQTPCRRGIATRA
jgi:hypothetical protein